MQKRKNEDTLVGIQERELADEQHMIRFSTADNSFQYRLFSFMVVHGVDTRFVFAEKLWTSVFCGRTQGPLAKTV